MNVIRTVCELRNAYGRAGCLAGFLFTIVTGGWESAPGQQAATEASWNYPLLAVAAGRLPEPGITEVACLGDSVTWGYWGNLIINEQTYPDYLGQLLGPGFEVRNFGSPSRTAGSYVGHESIAYAQTTVYRAAAAWQPNVMVAGLGINDCQSFYDGPRFEAGYRGVLEGCEGGRPHLATLLWGRLTPDFRGPLGNPAFPGNLYPAVRVFALDDYGTSLNRESAEHVLAYIALSRSAGLLDAYHGLENRPEWFPDGLHPNNQGLRHLANVAFTAMVDGLPPCRDPVLSEIAPGVSPGGLADEDGEIQPWVELWNSADRGVALAGYSLEALGNDPAVWQFPAHSVLAPGERCLVFASGKNRRVATANLHASFRISPTTKALVLRRQDGTAAGVVDLPPVAIPGSSYGLDEPPARVVGATSPGVRSVRSDSAPSGWQDPRFNDSAWGLGEVGGHTTFPVKAEAAFNCRWNADNLNTNVWSFVPASGAWTSLGNGTCSIEGFGSNATAGLFESNQDHSWTAEVRLRVDDYFGDNTGFVLQGGNWVGGGRAGSLGIETGLAEFGWPYLNARRLSYNVNNDGLHAFRLAYDAQSQRFQVWRDGLLISPSAYGLGEDCSLVGRLMMGTISPSHFVKAVIDYASYDTTGAYAPPLPQGSPDRSGTILLRMPFQIDAPHAAGMTLRLTYDDGIAVWLNGRKVLSENAPDAGIVAPLNRPDTRVRRAVSFDLGAYRALLTTGANVLAIQGFNAAANDGVFTLHAELVTRSQQGRQVVFKKPSPLTANDSGSDPLAAWRESALGNTAGPVLQMAASDADGDGFSDLLEYAFGTNPKSSQPRSQLRIEGNNLIFPWAEMPDTIWHLEQSQNLKAWQVMENPVATAVSDAGLPAMRITPQRAPAIQPQFYRLAVAYCPDWATWLTLYFGPAGGWPTGGVDYGADPDHDGMSNLEEFAFGLPPTTPNGNPIRIRTSPPELVFPLPTSRDGLTWHIESSANLRDWLPWNEPTRLIDDAQQGVMVSALLPANGPLFYRIHFTLPD